MTKDNPTPEPNPNPASNLTKVKKVKKKKRLNRSESSSSSEVDAVVPQLNLDESSREMYYDAHESYHALPVLPAPTKPLVTSPASAGTLDAYSGHGQDPKIGPQTLAAATGQGQHTESEKEPSSINKPT